MSYQVTLIVPDGPTLDATIRTLTGDAAEVGTLVTDTIAITVL